MRHGADPDHLAAIDGLTRIRPRATNGVWFALGHGLIVITLAVGLGTLIDQRWSLLGPCSLILVGAVNLWRLARPVQASVPTRWLGVQPFVVGMLLAIGFETASQLSALLLAGRTNAWVLGGAFASGMIAVDGIDGFLVASMQRLAAVRSARAVIGSRLLGAMVVVFAFGLGGAELAGFDVDAIALPLGVALFIGVVSIRIWVRSTSGMDRLPEGDRCVQAAPSNSISSANRIGNTFVSDTFV
jgi:high-affinity nickel-transport protein